MNTSELPPRTWADIDLAAIRDNLAAFRRRIPAGCRVVGVVKADAYGHGAVPVARLLTAAGVEHLAVACLDEAIELREAGLTQPIWHLGVPLPVEADALVAWGVTPTVTHPELLRATAEAAAASRPVPIHLKLDTGMGRRGGEPADLAALWQAAEATGRLRVEAVCTHFATADVDRAFAAAQLAEFQAGLAELAAMGLRPELVHAANGAAAIRLPASHFDLIRPGLAIYGITEFADGVPPDDLRPALAVRSRICQIRDLPAGHEVGYAHGCRLTEPTRVGLVPVGYGDGWPWRLSGVGVALVNGQRCRYLGRVNMDLVQLDLNNVTGCDVGTVVTLLGSDGQATIGAGELARAAGLSEYTISTCLTRRVVRRAWLDGELVALRGLRGDWQWSGSWSSRRSD